MTKEPTVDAERAEILSKTLGERPPRPSELKEINALYLLLEDKFGKAVSTQWNVQYKCMWLTLCRTPCLTA